MEVSENLPLVAQSKPRLVEVVEGEHYLWCSCGLSKKQPFCDGSHRGTDFTPVRYTAEKTAAVLFCCCKQTRDRPFCDGAHNSLSDEYAIDERPLEELELTTELVAEDIDGRALLDGGCYVQSGVHDIASPTNRQRTRVFGKLHLTELISTDKDSEHMTQFSGRLCDGRSGIISFPGAEVVLYIVTGNCQINISAELFDVGGNSGVLILRNEAFSIAHRGAEPLDMQMTICPGDRQLQELAEMPVNFNAERQRRIGTYDESERKTMADRFYQVLIGEHLGSQEISQFIGEVSLAKAAPHRHLYEEAILILSGEGVMWTETKRAPVKPGDVIFLPAQQEHSLQCTSPDGMALAGHFYPSGEPNINY